ncbi:streptophobe family protein [Streptomyces sp. NBC_00234]|uniref:streptophobe family protein n=1 Tax=Streptomyces sp. NBC_00234 TaxID=2903638 RepID=UPI002E2CAE30|nr:streptophobe family protein [Streptomyces sp. NBC_00234]
MTADTRAGGRRGAAGRGVPWADVALSSVASVSWALAAMAGAAALGLHLLGAGSVGEPGPMTAAVVVLGAGGTVSPSGDVSAFGLDGAAAHTALDVTPLGVGLVGALALSLFFLRSLRGTGADLSWGELGARTGAVAALFVAMVGGLAWAGHDVVTIDGGRLPGGGDNGAGGLPDGLGDLGGLLPDRLADLSRAEARVGFAVDTGASLAGGACWVLGVLVIALLASRAPLPGRAGRLHRMMRPAVSALVSVLLVAVLAGCAAAAYAAVGDAHPKRIAGAALLGAPNGAWLGVPLGLFVPWDGTATGALSGLLPDPFDELLRGSAEQPVTVGALAELDGRVWLLAVAAGVMMLYAGVLAAARTPRAPGGSATGFAVRCGLRLGGVTALALPLLVWLTQVSADASLSVLGFDAFGGGIELHGRAGVAAALGAAWGAGAGAAGALLAWSVGALPPPLPGGGHPGGEGAGPYRPSRPYRAANPDTNPYLRLPDGVHGAPTVVGRIGPPVPPPPGPGPGAPPEEPPGHG